MFELEAQKLVLHYGVYHCRLRGWTQGPWLVPEVQVLSDPLLPPLCGTQMNESVSLGTTVFVSCE